MLYKLLIISSLFLCANASGQSVENEQPLKTVQKFLWRQFSLGMMSTEVAALLTEMPEIKSVKILPVKKPGSNAKIKFQLSRGGFDIAEVKWKPEFRFEDDGLSQIWLSAQNQCAFSLPSVFGDLSGALAAKYPEHVQGPLKLDDSDTSRATLDAISRNVSTSWRVIKKNNEVAVSLNINFIYEERPSLPSGGGLILSLWKISNSIYEGNLAECNGTGNRRVNYEIGYLTTDALAKIKEEQIKARQDKSEDILDKI